MGVTQKWSLHTKPVVPCPSVGSIPGPSAKLSGLKKKTLSSSIQLQKFRNANLDSGGSISNRAGSLKATDQRPNRGPVWAEHILFQLLTCPACLLMPPTVAIICAAQSGVPWTTGNSEDLQGRKLADLRGRKNWASQLGSNSISKQKQLFSLPTQPKKEANLTCPSCCEAFKVYLKKFTLLIDPCRKKPFKKKSWVQLPTLKKPALAQTKKNTHNNWNPELLRSSWFELVWPTCDLYILWLLTNHLLFRSVNSDPPLFTPPQLGFIRKPLSIIK